MKLEPVTKLDKKNTSTLNKIQSYVMSANCNVIAFFRIYGKFTAIKKLDLVWSIKLTFSLIVTFYFAETANRSKKSLTQLLYYCSE